MLDFNHVVPLISLVRDRDGGSIALGPDGMPRINYSLSKHDQTSMEVSIDRSIRLLVAAGAKYVWTTQRGIGKFTVNPELGVNDPELEKFIQKTKSIGFTPGNASVGVAHQMGSW